MPPRQKKQTEQRSDPVKDLGAQASATVRQAAEVLESELAAGLDETRVLQDKLVADQRLDPGDLDAVADRLRRNAHSVIETVTERFAEMSSDQTQDLGVRFGKDAHQVVDSFLDLLAGSPGLVTAVLQRVQQKPE